MYRSKAFLHKILHCSLWVSVRNFGRQHDGETVTIFITLNKCRFLRRTIVSLGGYVSEISTFFLLISAGMTSYCILLFYVFLFPIKCMVK